MKQIKSIKELRSAILNESKHDFFILLNGGLRSSKCIDLSDDEQIFLVDNEIDGVEEQLTEEELMDPGCSNIGVAITKGAFYCYD